MSINSISERKDLYFLNIFFLIFIKSSIFSNCDNPNADWRSVILKFKPNPSCQSLLSLERLKVFKLIKRILPGPYALIMKSAHKLPKPFQKRRAIGVRIPNHPILMKLLPLLSAPLVSTSIHDTDKILDYTTNPDVLLEKWDSQIDLMLSDGFGRNIPSTVIDLTKNPFKIIRQGLGKNPLWF